MNSYDNKRIFGKFFQKFRLSYNFVWLAIVGRIKYTVVSCIVYHAFRFISGLNGSKKLKEREGISYLGRPRTFIKSVLWSEKTIEYSQNFWNHSIRVGLDGFNAGLDQVWDSSRRMIGRHAIAILIRHEGDGSPTLIPPEVWFVWELGIHWSFLKNTRYPLKNKSQ